MSDPSHTTEKDVIPYGKVVAVGVLSVILFTLGVLWATKILHEGQSAVWPHGEPRKPELIGQAEVGMVNQLQFELDTRASATREEQLERLRTTGWVDRDAGIVHIPIDQAMDALVQESAR